MKNKVIYGDYEGCAVILQNNSFYIETKKGYIALTKENISSWDICDEKRSISTASMMGRGLLGGLILGPIGIGIGAYSALKGQKEKLVQIIFKNRSKVIIAFSNDDFLKFKFYMEV
ncbi:MAG: hypothetical protein J6N45_09675 [Alphaproteobacteria bacterium]|nr:hypothetical protein [Alphaproteobacteria bacterium]